MYAFDLLACLCSNKDLAKDFFIFTYNISFANFRDQFLNSSAQVIYLHERKSAWREKAYLEHLKMTLKLVRELTIFYLILILTKAVQIPEMKWIWKMSYGTFKLPPFQKNVKKLLMYICIIPQFSSYFFWWYNTLTFNSC